MLPVWFINTIAEIINKQSSAASISQQEDSRKESENKQTRGLTLIQSTQKLTEISETIEKIDESMPIRRLRRAVESQLIQEFGLGFIQTSNAPDSNWTNRVFLERR